MKSNKEDNKTEVQRRIFLIKFSFDNTISDSNKRFQVKNQLNLNIRIAINIFTNYEWWIIIKS